MKKYILLTLLSMLSHISLHSECSMCLCQDLEQDSNENTETIRGPKCKCFCSLIVSEDATVGGNLTVNGDFRGTIEGNGGIIDGQLLVDGFSVNSLFNVSQYFSSSPDEITRACNAPNQTVNYNNAIAFPTGTVSGTDIVLKQTNATTFTVIQPSSGTLSGNLIFTATIQFDPSTTGATIAAVGTILSYPSSTTIISSVTQPAGQNQITITGTADSTLAHLQFVNKSANSAPVCISSANVIFVDQYHYVFTTGGQR